MIGLSPNIIDQLSTLHYGYKSLHVLDNGALRDGLQGLVVAAWGDQTDGSHQSGGQEGDHWLISNDGSRDNL